MPSETQINYKEDDANLLQDSRDILTLISGLIGLGLVISMILKPGVAFEASVSGLITWWEIVFPALLPFFIGAQMLMGLGTVHAMGIILEPIMRPLFNVPGCGSFVLAMGLASGYPIGAVLTGDLRRQDMLNKYEAERLVCAANTADPLFMAGAVAVGMFGNEALAGIIMIAHYISTLLNGILLRFYAPRAPITPPDESDQRPVLIRAIDAMLKARKKDGRPLGHLLKDSITNSVETLLLIGGFIILFSVIIDVLQTTPVAAVITAVIQLMLRTVGLAEEFAVSITSGIFEITLGCQAASETNVILKQQLTVVGSIIAWSGLSVHAQVAAILNDTDINIAPYFVSRIIHAAIAASITRLLWPFIPRISGAISLPVFSTGLQAAAEGGWLTWLRLSSGYFLFGLASLTFITALVVCLYPRSR